MKTWAQTGSCNFPVKYRFIFRASMIWWGCTDSNSIHLVFKSFVTKYTYLYHVLQFKIKIWKNVYIFKIELSINIYTPVCTGSKCFGSRQLWHFRPQNRTIMIARSGPAVVWVYWTIGHFVEYGYVSVGFKFKFKRLRWFDFLFGWCQRL